jgi:hypothetical protein
LEPWRDPEWQRLWLALESRPWTSLALVPAGEGGPEDFTLTVAVNLSRTGMVHIGAPIQVADVTNVQMRQLNQFLAEVESYAERGERILVALPPIGKSPLTTAIAQASGGALLCVMLERNRTSDAQRTIRQIGQARFLGTALFRPSDVDGGPIHPAR